MLDKEVKELLEMMENHQKKADANPELAKQALIRLGFLGENGKPTRKYVELCTPQEQV